MGLNLLKAVLVHSVAEAEKLAEWIEYPIILRPSRTLGGSGGGIVHNPAELRTMVSRALACSPNHEVLLEQSLIGWKELELEVMRDLKDT